MNARSRLTGLLALAAVASPQPEASAQQSLAGANASASLAPYVSELTAQPFASDGSPDATSAPTRSPQIATSDGSVGASITMATLGSVAGLFIGAMAGYGLSSDGDGDWGGLVVGGALGSFLGAGLGGAASARRPDRAFLGSALGMVAGGAIASALSGNDGTPALIGYSLTHGIVTGLLGASGG